jgi:hypothetical protein
VLVESERDHGRHELSSLPRIFNLRADPFEQGDNQTMGYDQWAVERLFPLVPAQQ